MDLDGSWEGQSWICWICVVDLGKVLGSVWWIWGRSTGDGSDQIEGPRRGSVWISVDLGRSGPPDSVPGGVLYTCVNTFTLRKWPVLCATRPGRAVLKNQRKLVRFFFGMLIIEK